MKPSAAAVVQSLVDHLLHQVMIELVVSAGRTTPLADQPATQEFVQRFQRGFFALTPRLLQHVEVEGAPHDSGHGRRFTGRWREPLQAPPNNLTHRGGNGQAVS